MTPGDRLRLLVHVQRFGYHLELRGVPDRRRRSLMSEISANARAAADEGGGRATIRGLGAPRALAVAMAEADLSRPRWALGAVSAAVVGLVMLVGTACTTLVVVQTLRAAGAVDRAVSVGVPPWIGVEVSATTSRDGGVSVGVSGALWYLLVPVAAFVVAARPWRWWTSRARRSCRATA